MKMIILAAGKGSRLMPLTENTPKSLIDIGNGTTMLEQQIKGAIKCSRIKEVIIITGYKSEQIEAKVKGYRSDIPIKIVFNPFYDVSNNLASLWTSHHVMLDDDFIITNGDNIYEDSIYEILNAECDKGEGIKVCVDFKDQFDSDDMKVSLKRSGDILKISKKIPEKEIDVESVGLTIVKGENYRRLFRDKIIELLKKEEYRDKFWLEILNSLVQDGLPIKTFEVPANDWREVDFHPDMEDIREIILRTSRE